MDVVFSTATNASDRSAACECLISVRQRTSAHSNQVTQTGRLPPVGHLPAMGPTEFGHKATLAPGMNPTSESQILVSYRSPANVTGHTT